jgi:hypothetical protein
VQGPRRADQSDDPFDVLIVNVLTGVTYHHGPGSTLSAHPIVLMVEHAEEPNTQVVIFYERALARRPENDRGLWKDCAVIIYLSSPPSQG